MVKMFDSPSKLVFVLVAVTACIAFGFGILTEANFMLLAGSVFGYFFAKKADGKVDEEGEFGGK